MKIAAVVVTYNRKTLLPECIEGILAQTSPVDTIYIVDNASTDGTEAFVREHYKDNPSIIYTKLVENTGSAGGFEVGVKAAYDAGAEWIWFLDDDVTPTVECLENLLKYQTISKCIHPSKYDSDGKEFMWEPIFDPATARTTFLNNISFKNGKEFTFVNIGCFEGMLLHRDIIEKIGAPDGRFFIVCDDALYGFLASLHTNVVFVKKAVLNKLLPFNKAISPSFLYYYVRNQFLVKEYLKKNGLFNRGLFWLYFVLFIFYAGTKHMVRNKSLSTVYYIVKGIIDGSRKRFYRV